MAIKWFAPPKAGASNADQVLAKPGPACTNHNRKANIKTVVRVTGTMILCHRVYVALVALFDVTLWEIDPKTGLASAIIFIFNIITTNKNNTAMAPT